jgi:hypothetical protein
MKKSTIIQTEILFTFLLTFLFAFKLSAQKSKEGKELTVTKD